MRKNSKNIFFNEIPLTSEYIRFADDFDIYAKVKSSIKIKRKFLIYTKSPHGVCYGEIFYYTYYRFTASIASQRLE